MNFKIAKDFTNSVKEKALGQNVLTSLQPGQLMVKLVKDELTELMGGEEVGVNLSGNPSVILMSGLNLDVCCCYYFYYYDVNTVCTCDKPIVNYEI